MKKKHDNINANNESSKSKKISKSSNNTIKIPKGDSLISENLLISSMKEDIKEFNPDDDISNDKEKNQKEI